MKTFLLALCLNATVLPSFAQNIKLKSKGDIDVAYVYNDPFGYFKYPKEQTFKLQTKQSSYTGGPENPGLYNLSSMALRLRAWQALGEIIIQPDFYYSLNKQGLSGGKHYVRYVEIAKYPDLVKRYNAIRPTTFYAVVGMGINPENEFEYGAYAFFNIPKSSVVITGSERNPYYGVPTSTSAWGSTVAMVWSDNKYEYDFKKPEDFQPTNARKETYQKFLNKATRAANYAWAKVQSGTVRKQYPEGQNVYLSIKWPEAEIDAIYEKYLKYERGDEKPPSKEVEDALAKKDLDPYSGNDEWGSAFEDDLKGVEAFNDYKTRTIGLKTKTRTIITFDSEKYNSISPLANTSYFVLTGKDYKRYIVDKRGNKQSIGGYQTFDYISSDGKGQVTAEINLSTPQFILEDNGLGIVDGNRFYSSHSEAAQAVRSAQSAKEQRYREEWAKKSAAEKERAKNTVELVMSHRYESVRLKRLVTTSTLNVLATKEGYLIR